MNDVFVHPSSIVDSGAVIGPGTKIWHFSHISGNEVNIGRNCSFGQNSYVGNRVRIGSNVRVQNNVSIYDCVTLEDDVFCGPSMVFTNVINPRAHIPRKDEFKSTLIKKGATLGANSTILCGVTVGSYAFVAAGAVVTTNVPDFALMVGVPAKQTGWMCQCGVKLPKENSVLTCDTCSTSYKLNDSRLVMK